MVDELDERIDECGHELARLGVDHPYIPLLLTVPGVGPLLALHHRVRDRRQRGTQLDRGDLFKERDGVVSRS
jgi:hypothetical protein